MNVPKFKVGDRVEMLSNIPEAYAQGVTLVGTVAAVKSCRVAHRSAYGESAGNWAGRQFFYEVEWDPWQGCREKWSRGGTSVDMHAEELLSPLRSGNHVVNVRSGDTITVCWPDGAQSELRVPR